MTVTITNSLTVLIPFFAYRHDAYTVKTPALRIVGSILAGDGFQMQLMINVSVLPCLLALLSCPKRTIRKEACWAISNITASHRSHIQAVIDCNIIPALINLLNNVNSEGFDTKKEALRAILNATSEGSPEQIRYLVEQGCIKPMCDMLATTTTYVSTVMMILEGFDHILMAGQSDPRKGESYRYAQCIEDAGGLDMIERLQTLQHEDVVGKAVEILENYFNQDDDEEECLDASSSPPHHHDASETSHPFTFGALSAALPKKETKEGST